MKFKKTGEPKKRLANYLFLIIILLLIFRTPLEKLKESIEINTLPIKEKVYTQTNSIKLGISNLKKYKEAMEQNSKLKVEVAKLEMLSKNNLYLAEENARLREILEMKEREERNFIVAKVSFKDSITYHENFFIDAGENDGIKKDMVVLTGMTLLGRVIEVLPNTSKVELITKDSIYTSALTEGEQHLGILRGNNSEILSFDNIAIDREMQVGEGIYTSGISDIYPKGLYVGKIVSVKKGEDRLFKEIEVKQDFNIFDLNEVIILGEE